MKSQLDHAEEQELRESKADTITLEEIRDHLTGPIFSFSLHAVLVMFILGLVVIDTTPKSTEEMLTVIAPRDPIKEITPPRPRRWSRRTRPRPKRTTSPRLPRPRECPT